MKGYKAFRKGLICRDKVYKENTVFEEDNAEICKSGMHFCKNPIDTLDYYHLIDYKGNITEFAEVEALSSAETDNNEKFCTKKLKIGSKLSLSQFIDASLNFASQKKKSNAEASDDETLIGGTCAKLVGGSHANLVGGDCAKLVGGNNSKLVGGNNTKLVGGDHATIVGRCSAKLIGGNGAKLIGDEYSTLVGDDWTELVGGDRTKLVGNNYAKLIGGNGAKLIGGDGAILTGGDYTTIIGKFGAELTGGYNAMLVGDCGSTLIGGNNAKLLGDCGTTLAGGSNAVIVGDNDSTAKGKKGSIIVLIERDSNLNIVNFKAVQVDGEKIKEDTPYKLEYGELVEAKEKIVSLVKKGTV